MIGFDLTAEQKALQEKARNLLATPHFFRRREIIS